MDLDEAAAIGPTGHRTDAPARALVSAPMPGSNSQDAGSYEDRERAALQKVEREAQALRALDAYPRALLVPVGGVGVGGGCGWAAAGGGLGGACSTNAFVENQGEQTGELAFSDQTTLRPPCGRRMLGAWRSASWPRTLREAGGEPSTW